MKSVYWTGVKQDNTTKRGNEMIIRRGKTEKYAMQKTGLTQRAKPGNTKCMKQGNI